MFYSRCKTVCRQKPVVQSCGGRGLGLGALLNEMKRRGCRYGFETICGGGGLGIAAVMERT